MAHFETSQTLAFYLQYSALKHQLLPYAITLIKLELLTGITTETKIIVINKGG